MARRGEHGSPLVRTEGLLVEKVGDETVILDTATHEVHCLAPFAAAVYTHCDGSNSVAELARLAGSRLDKPISEEQIEEALALLEERGLMVALPEGISRRALVRKTALATAAITAAPLVTSIVTPAFAQGSPNPRCPTAMCVSQEKGDEFCACNNVCPPGSPGAGSPSSCTSLGLTPPFFDSCFCAKCPTVGDPNPGQVPPAFAHLCPPMPFTPPACTGDNTNGGCNNSGKPVDGVCVTNTGDTSESCLNDPGA